MTTSLLCYQPFSWEKKMVTCPEIHVTARKKTHFKELEWIPIPFRSCYYCHAFYAMFPNTNDIFPDQTNKKKKESFRPLHTCLARAVPPLLLSCAQITAWFSSFPASVFIDGPLPDPSLVRPAVPNQMVNRMQSPGKGTIKLCHSNIFVPWFLHCILYMPRRDHHSTYIRTIHCSFRIKSFMLYHNCPCDFPGMNQFNQMGMQSMAQRSTPPLPMGASGNQVSTEHAMYYFSYQNAIWMGR